MSTFFLVPENLWDPNADLPEELQPKQTKRNEIRKPNGSWVVIVRPSELRLDQGFYGWELFLNFVSFEGEIPSDLVVFNGGENTHLLTFESDQTGKRVFALHGSIVEDIEGNDVNPQEQYERIRNIVSEWESEE